MKMLCAGFEVQLEHGVDIKDITARVTEIIRRSGVADGQVSVTAIGSTASITTIEFEPGAVHDLAEAVARLAPQGLSYAHEQAWHDGNGHSHVQAALVGPSQVFPVRQGILALGSWQQVVVINHDNRPRKRRVEVTVTGE